MTGAGRWRRWWRGRPGAHRRMRPRSPRSRIGSPEFPRCAAGMREGRLSVDQVGVIAERAGAGIRCALRGAGRGGHGQPVAHRGEAGTAPGARSAARPRALDQQDLRCEVHHYRITLAAPGGGEVRRGAGLAPRRAQIAEWKRDHDADARGCTRRRESGQRPPMPTTVDAFMGLVEAGWDCRGGSAPARAAHHRGGASGRQGQDRRRCTWVRCCPTPTADTSPATPPARRGSNATAKSSAPGGAPVRSAGGCAAPWSTATRTVRCPAAGPPAVCTPITSGTGRTAGPPSWTTWCCCVRITTGCIIAASSPSPATRDRLTVTDSDGQELSPGSLARPPTTPPPAVPPCTGPTGERADWWWYDPVPTPTTTDQQLTRGPDH